jgi:membrane protease YdiL (CAAX protease family)
VSGGDVLLLALAVSLLSLVVIAANLADRQRESRLRRPLLLALLLGNVFVVIAYGIMPLGMAYLSPEDPDAPQKTEAWAGLVISVLTGGVATALLLESVRRRLAVLFPRQASLSEADTSSGPGAQRHASLQPQMTATPLFAQMLNYYTERTSPALAPLATGSEMPAAGVHSQATTGFNPGSTVHAVAMILCVYFLGMQMIGFVLGGGITGIAAAFEDGLTAWELLANAAPFVILAVLGVGVGVRRTWRQALLRLGLTWPTGRAVMISLAVVLGLFMYVALVSGLWMALVSEETYRQQTEASEALAASVTSIGLAFALAATAAVGEEIAYRGALQPVFGLWPTAIVFTLAHAQYTLTPAWLIILGVAATFGWLRQRYGTVAAIIAHFVYNFVPLAIAVWAPDERLLSLVHLLF